MNNSPSSSGPAHAMADAWAQGPLGSTGSAAGEADELAAANTLLARSARWLASSPAAAWNVLVLVALACVLGLVMHQAGRQVRLSPGMVMDQARVVRAVFTLEDKPGTESRRQAARQRSPRVYAGDAAYFDQLLSGLENLPRAMADAASLAQVDPQIRGRFGVTNESLAALQEVGRDPARLAEWSEGVGRLVRSLERLPLVDAPSYQRETLAPNQRVGLVIGDAPMLLTSSDSVIDAGSQAALERLPQLARDAGFTGPALDAVRLALGANLRPTFRFDDQATASSAAQAAAGVTPVTNTYVVGQLLAAPGEVLSPDKVEVLAAEMRAFRAGAPIWTVLAHDAGLWGAALLAALGLGAYAATYSPALWRSPARLGSVAMLAGLCASAACLLGVVEPRAMNAAVSLPTLLLTMVLAVAYDRRTALALGSLVGILSCVALEQPVATIGIALSGVWTAAWRLREFRSRHTLVRAGLASGFGIAVATLLLAGLQRPMVGAAWNQTLVQAAQGGIGALLVALIVLGALPLVERLFDTCTGMTLIELRDPQHPLLRLLQQRAPGTYSHSLNVASLSEAAAQAIGADGLLTYVGALYHDVGKADKPEYFVENQTGGINRHDRLSPAMSLLVIVGHVKEGLALARRHALPRVLHHFIEAHHGTTLVEYFYHRARKQAESGALLPDGTHASPPQEIEYRYPGPRPRTREAAIVMVCDAAESAARAMSDACPTKIDALVRSIANKRLLDGQFDDCDLSLRDLATIVETVSRTLGAIHHSRIAYPEPALGASSAPAVQNGASPASVAATPVNASPHPATGDWTAPTSPRTAAARRPAAAVAQGTGPSAS